MLTRLIGGNQWLLWELLLSTSWLLKTGHGNTIGVVLIVCYTLFTMWATKERRGTMKKLQSIWPLSFGALHFQFSIWLLMPLMLGRHESFYRIQSQPFQNSLRFTSDSKPKTLLWLSCLHWLHLIGTFGAIYIYQARKKYQDAFLYPTISSW